jgi:hypothetical protein
VVERDASPECDDEIRKLRRKINVELRRLERRER